MQALVQARRKISGAIWKTVRAFLNFLFCSRISYRARTTVFPLLPVKINVLFTSFGSLSKPLTASWAAAYTLMELTDKSFCTPSTGADKGSFTSGPPDHEYALIGQQALSINLSSPRIPPHFGPPISLHNLFHLQRGTRIRNQKGSNTLYQLTIINHNIRNTQFLLHFLKDALETARIAEVGAQDQIRMSFHFISDGSCYGCNFVAFLFK